MIKISAFIILAFTAVGCSKTKHIPPALKEKPLTSYVNTFIGTGGHGHTYPGATMPFGMMQLSPDTRLEGWDGCSGYHYSDDYIYGFSHTHLSGTGVSDYGDILLMPTNGIKFHNGADGEEGYGSHFSHEREEASPGFYKVHLDDTNIDVALAVTQRAGMHQYSFPDADKQYVILDLLHRDKVLDANIEIVSNSEIQGHRHSKAWAADQRLYFSIKTSHPFRDMLQSPPKAGMAGAQKAALHFINPHNEPITISIGISAVSVAGAINNRRKEIGAKTFEELKNEANDSWEQQLEKIVIETTDDDNKTNFYTALYHTMLAPNLYQDVDGKYRGMDLEIHQTNDFDYYTVFSLWDTYRAAHPLYTLIEQKRTNDFINTMLAKYDEGGILPIWDLSANYTGCMIGYHGVPVIADAYMKGIRDYDTEKAFQAMLHSATRDHLGLDAYKKNGFVPVEEESESVSKTLEYAYDDWTIAQMAQKLGKEDVYKTYLQRAQSYKNLYNPETNFFQGRFNNTWFGPFDPFEVNFNYTEANAWQYSLYAPQDISGLITLMGGKRAFENHLDQLFTATSETSGRDQADITGLIGQYAHGNEPSHHMAYLYNFVNTPHKTQELTRDILTKLYTNAPDGISGNEDCGQMSAWYVFSSLGFYPVTPVSNQYIVGAPLFEKATIHLENGESFTIVSNVSDKNRYIQNALLNGKPLHRTYLYHDEIIAGGSLEFTMTDTPTDWGTHDSAIPSTEIKEHLIVTPPYISEGSAVFKDSTIVQLKNTIAGAEIYASLDENEFQKYTQPFTLLESTVLKTYAILGDARSSVLVTDFNKIAPNRSILLATQYANEYNAGGNDALIDGMKGAKDFRTGAWQGYQDKDLVATVDLGRVQPIDQISVNFLLDQRSWIFLPTEVMCYVSDNPNTFYKSLPKVLFPSKQPSDSIKIETATFNMKPYSGRYIKIVAKNAGALPKWHLGYPYGGKAWIFVDEIEIN